MKILFVSAHPDDIEFSCSGLIKNLLKKNEVYFLICTNGALGDPKVQRIKELKDVLRQYKKIGNIKCSLLNLKECEITRKDTIFLEEKIKEIKPDIIFTHWNEDTHQDHIIVSENIKSICYRNNINLIFFDSVSSLNFKPNLFLPIDFSFKKKIIKKFKSTYKKYFNKIKKRALYYSDNDEKFYEVYKADRIFFNKKIMKIFFEEK